MTDSALKPMNIYQAVEVMKILTPHQEPIAEAFKQSAVKGILALLEETRDGEPGALLRLIALMQDIHVEKAAELYGDWSGREIMALLADMFVTNPLPDLYDGAYVLGLISEGWKNARD